jgi:hypothetical protein
VFGGEKKYSRCQEKRHQDSWWRDHGGVVWKRPYGTATSLPENHILWDGREVLPRERWYAYMKLSINYR